MTIKNICLYFIAFIFFTISFLFSFGQNKTDSLLKVVKSSKYDTNMVLALADLCFEYHYNDLKKANLYGQKGLVLAKKIGYIKGFAMCNNNIGTVYFSQGDYQKALEYYQKSLKIYQYINLKKEIPGCYQNIGSVYIKKGKYKQAIEYFQKSLEIIEKYGDKNRTARCYINIGIIHKEQRNYPQALKYYERALKIYKEIDYKRGIAECYNNIGSVKYFEGSVNDALEYYKKALEINKFTGNKIGESTNYNNIGAIYTEQGNSIVALEYFKKSLKIKEELNDERGISACYTNLSHLSLTLKNYRQALEYSNKALILAKKLGTFDLKQNAYLNLSIINDNLGNIKDAFRYYKLYSETKDSILNKESQKKIVEMEVKYETEKKEKEIIKQNTKIALLEQGDKIEKYKRNGLIAGVFLISLLCIFIFFNLRKRIKLNVQLYKNQKEQFRIQKLLAESELNNEKLQSLQLHKELEYKNKELINFALHIVEKNDFLEELKLTLLNSFETIKPKELIFTIDQNLMSLEKERKEFEASIEKVSESFSMKLREKFPDVTKSEDRLSALLRLNLSSKEIAMILNISSQSIDKYRYKLRKKFNLKEEVNLYDFLNSI
ncbi:MAG: tetratricopeptide repeat protein [Bacteroidetes bacterium]|nr:tetratricopeptide repeat protein [Bacteroidota bacterium]